MGGMLQPSGHAYVLTNRVDYGLDVQEAVDFPRIFYEDRKVLGEASVPAATMAALASMGHETGTRGDPWGGAQMIEIDPATGVRIGASDPRKDGAAIGY
jgi:gamma-glutamyltranspeptidase/glutathione hydrolase